MALPAFEVPGKVAWTILPHDIAGDTASLSVHDDARWNAGGSGASKIYTGMIARGHTDNPILRTHIAEYISMRRRALLLCARASFLHAQSPTTTAGATKGLMGACNWGSLLHSLYGIGSGAAAPTNEEVAQAISDAATCALTVVVSPRGIYGKDTVMPTTPVYTGGVFRVVWPSLFAQGRLQHGPTLSCRRWWDTTQTPMLRVFATEVSPARAITFDAYMLRCLHGAYLSQHEYYLSAARAWTSALALLSERAWDKMSRTSALKRLPSGIPTHQGLWMDNLLCTHANSRAFDPQIVYPLVYPENCPLVVTCAAYMCAIEHCAHMTWWESARHLCTNHLQPLLLDIHQTHIHKDNTLQDTIGRMTAYMKSTVVRCVNALSPDGAGVAPAETEPKNVVELFGLPIVEGRRRKMAT